MIEAHHPFYYDRVRDAAWAAMRSHAEKEWPRESVGVIDVEGVYHPLENRSRQPRKRWWLRRSDLAPWRNAPIVHSHPNGWPCPSKRDMKAQITLGVPFGIVPVTDAGAADPFFWPDAMKPYLGRPYRHGVTDCLQLVRDWLKRERGIEVPPFAYGWQERGDLFSEGIRELGWELIEPMAAVAGDVVLLGRGRATHCGVLLEDGRLLHHPGMKPYDPTCLSRREPVARLSRLVVGVVRPA